MATRQTSKPAAPAPAAPAIDPAGTYDVTLAKAVRVGRGLVVPGRAPRLRGDVLAKLVADDPEAVTAFAPATAS